MISPLPRRPIYLSLRPELVAEARDLQINLSRACEGGLAAEIRQAKAERWLRDNQEALEEANRWVEDNDLPLERHRLF